MTADPTNTAHPKTADLPEEAQQFLLGINRDLLARLKRLQLDGFAGALRLGFAADSEFDFVAFVGVDRDRLPGQRVNCAVEVGGRERRSLKQKQSGAQQQRHNIYCPSTFRNRRSPSRKS